MKTAQLIQQKIEETAKNLVIVLNGKEIKATEAEYHNKRLVVRFTGTRGGKFKGTVMATEPNKIYYTSARNIELDPMCKVAEIKGVKF